MPPHPSFSNLDFFVLKLIHADLSGKIVALSKKEIFMVSIVKLEPID